MRTIKLLLVMLFSFAIAACGGGGGGTSTPSTPTPQTGILTDAAVGGVAYTTAPSGLTGTTDSSGAYKFNSGDTVIFKLGSLELGNVIATGIVSPTDLAKGDANKLQNLLVVLQSLDADGNPNNGIVIPPAAAAAVTTAIDLTVAPASLDTTALQTAMTAGGITTPVVTPTDANAHYLAQGMSLLSSNVWVGSALNGNALLWRMTPAGEFIFGEAGGTPGVEHGTTTLTAFDVKGYQKSVTVDLDTNAANGGIFPSGNNPCTRLRTNGDQLILAPGALVNGSCVYEPENTLSKADNNPTGIVGVWALDSATTINTQHIVFFSNGQFLLTDPIGGVDPSLGVQPPGVESGSYTYDTATKILKIIPNFDTNGTAGFSNNGAATVGEPFFISLGGSTATAVDNVGSYTFHRVLPPAAPSPYAGTWAASFKLKTVGGTSCGATAANIGVVQSMGSLVVDSVGNFVLMNDLNLNFAMMAGTISANGQFNATWFGDSLLPAGTPGKSPTCPAGAVTGTMANTSSGVVTLSQGGDTGDLTLSHVDPMIVGAWSGLGANGTRNNVTTFFANGEYVQAVDGAAIAGDGQSGMERGTYIWNSTTGAFTSTCAIVDTNDRWGFSEIVNNVCTGLNVTVAVSGNTLTLNDGTSTGTFTRVVDANIPLVGSWSLLVGGHNSVVTFLANGEYVHTQDGQAVGIGHTGMERGTYTWNSATGAFATGGCPAVDTNGDWGFSHQVPDVCSGSTLTMTVSGNALTFSDGTSTITATRVVP